MIWFIDLSYSDVSFLFMPFGFQNKIKRLWLSPCIDEKTKTREILTIEIFIDTKPFGIVYSMYYLIRMQQTCEVYSIVALF